jgi:hypothetical protein
MKKTKLPDTCLSFRVRGFRVCGALFGSVGLRVFGAFGFGATFKSLGLLEHLDWDLFLEFLGLGLFLGP